jgi:hypothetical protein
MGAKIIKYENVEHKKTNELIALHKIQDRVIAQTERENILKDELIRTQE